MQRLLIAIIAVGLLSRSVRAQLPEVGVDPRVELLSIVFRLAGNPEYNMCRFPAYEATIEERFGALREHAAVREARRLREAQSVSFDAVMSMAIHVTDPPALAERVPFDAAESSLEPRWQGANARPFVAALRDLVVEHDFAGFLTEQGPLFDTTRTRLSRLLELETDMAWFGSFFGERPAAEFRLVPGLCNGGGNYGPRFVGADGREELFAIVGVTQVDSVGFPVFGPRMVPTVVHEFNHSFVNPAVAPHAARLADAAGTVFAAVEDPMRAQAYGNGITVVNESLVRATAARYQLSVGGAESADRAVVAERARGFVWLDELFALLGEYEAARDVYPTFVSFLPRLVSFWDSLAPRVPDLVRAYDERRPALLSIAPALDAEDVDPATGELVLRFDRPMGPGYSLNVAAGAEGRQRFPDLSSPGWDTTGTMFTARIALEPDRPYELRLNGPAGGGFMSRDGYALAGTPIRFRTRAR